MSNHKISISFTMKNLDLYEYLKSKDNISAYIMRLIRADLEHPQEDAVWEKKVEAEVLKVLSRLDPTALSGLSQIEAEKGNEMSQADRDLLSSLF